MDPITQANLVTLHIKGLLRDRQSRHEAGAPRYGGPASVATVSPTPAALLRRLRRHLGAVLIRTGRRLGDGARPRSYPLYGSAHR